MIERLLSSDPPSEEVTDENDENDSDGDGMKLTSIQSITDFIACAGKTLPENIQVWARRNLVVAKSNEVSPEERRHAQRALSTMMSINWKIITLPQLILLKPKEFLMKNYMEWKSKTENYRNNYPD